MLPTQQLTNKSKSLRVRLSGQTLRDSHFMATVRERFIALGIPQSKPILSLFGGHVSTTFCNRNLFGRVVKDQEEDGVIIRVWDYPEDWVPEMDKIILDFLRKSANG